MKQKGVTHMDLDDLRKKCGFIIDMDGVIYHGNRLLPGVQEFLKWLRKEEKNFLSRQRVSRINFLFEALYNY